MVGANSSARTRAVAPLVEASTSAPAGARILQPGRNCWRIAKADRVAFVVDAAAYYAAVLEAFDRAEHDIIIVGWDIDARVRMRHEQQDVSLADALSACVRAKPGLRAWVLGWDFSPIYVFERGVLSRLRFAWGTPQRVHYRLDAHHAAGGAHHEKLVVIDDSVAFCGGLDLCDVRWDTPAHDPCDPRRVDLTGKCYRPHHDVQMAVDGAAAAALGELVRQRWADGGGRALPPPAQHTDCWPPLLRVDVRDVEVGIARTRGPIDDGAPVREVEQLWHDSVAAARSLIYIENPYLTSEAVSRALQASLRAAQGPEIAVVLPQDSSGWMEDITVGVLRERAIAATRQADDHDRLSIVSPWLPPAEAASEPISLNLHGKVCIIDDAFVRIGSANLTNRSMGLDSECDLVIEAGDREDVRAAIAALRVRLMAEHLDCHEAHVAEATAQTGLRATIRELAHGDRALRPYRPQPSPLAEVLLPPAELIDPDRPLGSQQIGRWLTQPSVAAARSRRWKLAAAGWWALCVAVLVVLRVTGVLDDALFTEALAAGQGHPWLAAMAVIAVFVIGGIVLVPVTLLIASCGAAFGPWLGLGYGLLGAFTGAALYHGLGRLGARAWIDTLAGPRVRATLRRVARRGVFAVALLRVLPVAPHMVVGLAAGAARIPWWKYMLATMLVMTPGAFVLTVLGHRLRGGATDGWALTAVAVGLAALVVVVTWAVKRWAARGGGVVARPERTT